MKWFFSVAVVALSCFPPGVAGQAHESGSPGPSAVTGKWIGIFEQPKGVNKFYPIQLDLEQDKNGNGKVRGKLRLEMAGKPQIYHLMSVEGVRYGEFLQLKDVGVIESVRPPGGAVWFTKRNFELKLGTYQTLVGQWSDPKNTFTGKGPLTLTRLDYRVVIERKEVVTGGLVRGELSVNGIKLGPVYENAQKMIPAGSYPGVRRYTSDKRFVQSTGGLMATTGDFLLEIAKVPGRSDVLIHPGNKAEHSVGCVLAGPAQISNQKTYAPKLLREMRLHFYGTDAPNFASPVYLAKEKAITVEIKDLPSSPGERIVVKKTPPLLEGVKTEKPLSSEKGISTGKVPPPLEGFPVEKKSEMKSTAPTKGQNKDM